MRKAKSLLALALAAVIALSVMCAAPVCAGAAEMISESAGEAARLKVGETEQVTPFADYYDYGISSGEIEVVLSADNIVTCTLFSVQDKITYKVEAKSPGTVKVTFKNTRLKWMTEIYEYVVVSNVPETPERPALSSLSYDGSDITVAWSAAKNAAQYRVARKKTGDTSYTYATVNGTGYTEKNAAPGVSYTYQVQGINETVAGPWSSSLSIVTLTIPNVGLSCKSNGIRAEWASVSGASKYRVYYKSELDKSWSSAETANTYYPLLNTVYGRKYAFQIQPLGTGGINGPYSAVRNIVYVSPYAATIPSLSLSVKSNGIRAEWNLFPGATSYTVYYRKAAESRWSSVSTQNIYYPFLSAAVGETYCFQVQPVFGNTRGAYSNVQTIKYTHVTNEIPVVTVSNKSNGIRSEWNSVVGATSYIVYYRRFQDSKWSSAETKNNYYPFLSAKEGTAYCFQVQPVFYGERGGYSNVKTITYRSTASRKPMVTVNNKWNGMSVGWDAVPGATSYVVYYREEGVPAWNHAETKNTYYPLLNVKNGERYAVQVRAMVNGAGGEFSDVWHITYTAPASGAPAVSVAKDANGVTFRWNPVSGAKSYTIAYLNMREDKWKYITVSADVNSYRFGENMLEHGQYFYFSVCADLGTAYGSWSADEMAFYL